MAVVEYGVIVLEEFGANNPLGIAAIRTVVRMKQELAYVLIIIFTLNVAFNRQIEIAPSNEQLNGLKRFEI